jgi:DNA polymerase III subunit alpha
MWIVMSFVHLHAHSHYSLLSALTQIDGLVQTAAKHEMSAIALTDNGNMYGAIEFYKACLKAKIKPILGVDFYIASRTRHDKESGIDNKRTRIVLLARTNVGYKNLIKLVTYSHLEGFYYKPRVDKELLERYQEGLLAIVPAFNSEITNALRSGHTEEALTVINRYKEWYGDDAVYLELTKHSQIDGHDELMGRVKAFATEHSLPLLATNDVHYLTPDEQPARRTLLSIQSGGEFRGGAGSSSTDADLSFKTPEQMAKLFADEPEALANTLKVAEMCTIEIPLGAWFFPSYAIPEGTTYETELRRIVWEKAKEKGFDEDAVSKTRTEFELDIICSKGYAPYFLVVGDLLAYAHEHGILTNTRGSVGGSLVSYLLGVTNVDPLEYKLPFERFLNPFRPSPPDIDLDIADNRRDEMIAYARQKYGEDKVAQIGTFGTMMARGSVRDTARAMGYDLSLADEIAKMIPFGSQGFPMSIERAMEQEPDLKKRYKEDEDVRRLIDMAQKVEGCARHISVHAAGVVLSPIPLEDIVPVQWDPKGEGKLITQYDMHAVEDIGLLKFDFLGLKNLAILSDAVYRVEKIYDEKVDIATIPIDDKKTFQMLAKGETMSVFQLAGSGMTQALKELRPTSIHDINLMVALYRPGPMDNIKEYIARKHGQKATVYAHPKMKDFLDTTYGVLVYQDDLLMTAIEVAGYSWEEVDKFRYAVGKKVPEAMAKQHVIFVEGCMKHSGTTKEKAEELWDLFEPFQGYGFNKAHAASYGRLAYQTAYMKANYPTAYMAAVLTADAGDVEKIAEIIAACKRMNIDVLPPDVNESLADFSVVTKEMSADGVERIRFGLYSIKNFGEGVGDAIIAERKANGPFTSLDDFLIRVKDRNLNRKSLEALIKCGALDVFGERGVMLANIDDLLAHHKQSLSHSVDQTSLFGGSVFESAPLKLKSATPATRSQMLAWEKDLLGLYVSGHPLDAYRQFLSTTNTSIEKLKGAPVGLTSIVYGHLDDVRPILTKRGEKMAFVHVSDMTGTVEVVIFPRIYESFKALLIPETCIGIKGKMSSRNGEISIIADIIKPMTDRADKVAV